MINKIVLGLVVSGLLLGCGSSETKDVAVLVDTGVFKDSNQTGIFYTPNIDGYSSDYNFGINSELCQSTYRDRYYETENALVFGDPKLANGDFFAAAGWVESSFSVALAAMAITKAEYYAARTNVSLTARQKLRQGLSTLNQAGQRYGSFVYPATFDQNTDYATVSAWLTATAQQANLDQVAQTLIADPYSGYTSVEQIRLQNKIYVCIHDSGSDIGWGEGHLAGINIGAYSKGVPYSVNQLIVHELVHSMQYALSAGIEGLSLPRWFSEGQAVYLSGQNRAAASQHTEYDPTKVINFFDEYGDPGIAYKHYGLAYQYVQEANGIANIKAMMNKVKTDKQVPVFPSVTQLENANYIKAFDALMVDINKKPLTVEQYRTNYHSYLNDFASK